MMFSSGVSYVFSGCQRRIRVVLERSVVESAGLFAGETWLEQDIDAMKAFSAELCVKIHNNVAQFLYPSIRISGCNCGRHGNELFFHDLWHKSVDNLLLDALLKSALG